jgi:hypothetical protein
MHLAINIATPMAAKRLADSRVAGWRIPIAHGPRIPQKRPNPSIIPTAVPRTSVSYQVAPKLFRAPWPPNMQKPALPMHTRLSM